MKLICLLKKKEGLSDEDFKAYYETQHAPLALSLIPYFASYNRHYLIKKDRYKPEHLENPAEIPDFDVITELEFSSSDDYEKMVSALADPEIGGVIAEDEERFLDRNSMVMFFVETESTSPDQLKN